jgi:UDP:flavonoid glycosyltransferase YjiC (YdhE family)
MTLRLLALLFAAATLFLVVPVVGRIGTPSPLKLSRIVFSCPISLSEFNMFAPVAQELQRRGHTVEILGNTNFPAKQKNLTLVEFSDFWAQKATFAPLQQLADVNYLSGDLSDSFAASKALGDVVGAVIGQNYETWYTFLNQHFEKTGKPDLIISDFFSIPTIDWAKTNGAPLLIFHAIPFGHLPFGDCLACPSGHVPVVEGSAYWDSFVQRLKKLVVTIHMIAVSTPGANVLNQIRASLGVEGYMGPTDNWNGRTVIATNSWTFDNPRYLSPQTTRVGLLVTPLPPQEEWNAIDLALWQRLDKIEVEHGRVAYMSFGSEYWMSSEETLTKVAKGACAALQGRGKLVIALREKVIEAYGGKEALLKKFGVGDCVVIEGWVNQMMLLSHSSVKLFISHCGLQSLGESLYNMVPILGVPRFADQPVNALHVKSSGLGDYINHKAFTVEEVTQKVAAILDDDKMKETLQQHWKLNFFGYPSFMKAADAIELDLQVDPALVSPAEDQSGFIIAHGLDIIGFLLTLFVLFVLTLFKLFSCIFCSRKSRTNLRKKKLE